MRPRVGAVAIAKSAIRGIITSFRGAKRVRYTHYAIVEIGEGTDPATLVGAKVLWTREGFPRISGRVIARHGRGSSVRVRWRKGFPAQGIGTPVEIVVK